MRTATGLTFTKLRVQSVRSQNLLPPLALEISVFMPRKV